MVTLLKELFMPTLEFPMAPADIQHAVQYPDLDPFCGVVVVKMLQRKPTKDEEPLKIKSD